MNERHLLDVGTNEIVPFLRAEVLIAWQNFFLHLFCHQFYFDETLGDGAVLAAGPHALFLVVEIEVQHPVVGVEQCQWLYLLVLALIEDPQVDIPTVEPMDDDQPVFETQNDKVADDRLIIPSTEIPAAVITEEQRAKIREEVDAIANDDNTDYTGWMPRQIPVEKSAFSVEVIDKSELESVNNVITDVSRKNVKESILENTGVEIK